MNNEGKPVRPSQLTEQLKSAFPDLVSGAPVDFSNTEIAFADKADPELKKMAWLFRLMNNPKLVAFFSKLALLAARLRLPFFEKIVRSTMFYQFCGGATLLEAQQAIDRLHRQRVDAVLDYGAEGKESEDDFNQTMNENIRAIDFAATHHGIPIISTKITGLARFDLLEKISNAASLTQQERSEYKSVLKRIDNICHHGVQKGVGVFIDAEESWIQQAVDHIAGQMMRRYNKQQVYIYNTFQLYRHDRLKFLMLSFDRAQQEGYLLGAKLVRGAYMEKERKRAAQRNEPSPIHTSKEAADHDYNLALRFCLENYEKIGCCNASHNAESNLLMAQIIQAKKLPRNHPHLRFCQLYGMGDNLTFNLAAAGFNASKYVVYGQVLDVVPYLIRRSQENTSVTGDLGRELGFIQKEIRRRQAP